MATPLVADLVADPNSHGAWSDGQAPIQGHVVSEVPYKSTYTPTKEQVQEALTVHFDLRKHCYKSTSKWFFLRRTADRQCSTQAWAEVVAYDTGMGIVLSPAYAAALAGAIASGAFAFSLAVVGTAVPAAVFAVPAMMYEPVRVSVPALAKHPNRLNQAAWSGANFVVRACHNAHAHYNATRLVVSKTVA